METGQARGRRRRLRRQPGSCFGTLDWAVGQLYAERYFPAATKAAITSLVGDVKAAFRHRLATLDWMSPATRREALKKLDTYIIKVGYPDTWRDYSNVVIRRDDLVGNVRRAAAADWDFYVQRSKGPVDKSDWGMTPQTNDAYNGSLRDIVFPAGILQAPMFDPNADPAFNYGAIGGVIGHELTHGFDDQGRKIDAKGALRDWWTAKDAAEFKRRAKMLGDQYAQFEPVPGVHINPDLTMGENIADLGGLTMGARRLSCVAARQAGAGARRPHRRSARVPRLGAGMGGQGHAPTRSATRRSATRTASANIASTASSGTSTPGTRLSA